MNTTYKRHCLGGIAAVFLIILALVAAFVVAPASKAEASIASASLAPVNSAFSQFIQERLFDAPSRTIDGRALGGMPASLDPSATRGLQVPATSLASLPATYDLRSLGRVTSVKNQGPNGTCWSFASYGSLESSLLTAETLDFSEDNLVLNSGFWSASSTASSLYNNGGNFTMSTAYLVRWGGPVYESDDAYGDGYTPAGLTPRKHVQEVEWIPARASALDNNNVKNAVMLYGGVYAAFRFEGSSAGSSYYKASTASYYYNGSSSSNHAVVIVGWDDNYAASNFATTPPGPGAFIVKNSWGTSWGSGGYFYVSYYDSLFGRSDEMAAFDDAESTTNYTGIYQYDPLGVVGTVSYSSTSAWFANIFTAQSTSSVSAVGFYTLRPGASYQVYTGSSLGSLTLRTSGTLAYMGYHTVTLPSPMSITSGQRFVVAAKIAYSSGSCSVALEYPYSTYSPRATASTGQSYISSNGVSWSDVTTAVIANGNVCLKAYTGGSSTPGYALTVSVGTGSGSVTKNPNLAVYPAGTQVTLTPVPTSGYAFTSWGGDVSGSANPLTVTVNSAMNITANFTAVPGTTRYEENNPLLVYSGSWTTVIDGSASFGAYKYTGSSGSTVTATFTGTAVTYICRTGPGLGSARITLDGVSQSRSLSAGSAVYQVKIWSATGLAPGRHVLTIQCGGSIFSRSSINVDALEITGGNLV